MQVKHICMFCVESLLGFSMVMHGKEILRVHIHIYTPWKVAINNILKNWQFACIHLLVYFRVTFDLYIAYDFEKNKILWK